MKTLSLPLLAGLLACLTVAAEDNWPEFRGPRGNGHSDAKGLPVKWSATENVKWRAPIAGIGRAHV